MNYKNIWRKIFPYIKNKYIIVLILFIVWITFLDENRLIDRIDAKMEVTNLTEQNNYYNEQIKRNNIKLNELQTNKENLERFAREEYLMKKPNEDIFVIVETEED